MNSFFNKFNSITFYVLIPVIIAVILFGFIIIQIVTIPLESYFQEKITTELKLASQLGLSVCDENFNQLLSLRLEDNSGMLATMRKDAIKRIHEIRINFLDMHILIIENDTLISKNPFNSNLSPTIIKKISRSSTEISTFSIKDKTIYYYSRYFPFWRWKIISIIPYEKAFTGVTTIKHVVTGALISIICIFSITFFLAFQHFIKKPLLKITDATKKISEGTYTKIERKRQDEMGDVIASFNGMVKNLIKQRNVIESTLRKLEDSLNEKEVLLREIHHRVKNNLNIVVSLLNLQIDSINSPQDAIHALRQSQNRVYSMSLVHKKLYETDNLARIDMENYINSLVSELKNVYGYNKNIRFTINVQNTFLSIDYAVPCGLLLNELVTNSMLHAFPPKWQKLEKQPIISITMNQNNRNHITIEITDNGIGISNKNLTPTPNTLGLELIHILTEQLNGNIHTYSKNGTIISIDFPVNNAHI